MVARTPKPNYSPSRAEAPRKRAGRDAARRRQQGKKPQHAARVVDGARILQRCHARPPSISRVSAATPV